MERIPVTASSCSSPLRLGRGGGVHPRRRCRGLLPALGAEPALRDHYHVIRYRRRGHAGSTPVDGPVSIAEHAQGCRALLSELDVTQAHVVGHSYGGCVALRLAVDARGPYPAWRSSSQGGSPCRVGHRSSKRWTRSWRSTWRMTGWPRSMVSFPYVGLCWAPTGKRRSAARCKHVPNRR